MLEKTYEPAAVEARIYAEWQEAGAFKAGAGAKPGAETFSIVIPPPNVTGSLHIGHALNNTIQDILIRFERMRGKDVLWQPGTDHAGIATQMIVERQLMERQQPSSPRARDARSSSRRVWEWKAESQAAPSSISSSAWVPLTDWSRERFTMDEGLSARRSARSSSRSARKGPYLSRQAAGELAPRSRDGHLRPRGREHRDRRLHVALEATRSRTRDESIVVATTRPETMLGDVPAVAVNPADERYQAPRSASTCNPAASSAAAFRSLPTSTLIRSLARAR